MANKRAERKTVSAVFSRILSGKPDEYHTHLELEIDDTNIPGAVMMYHITGRVPDGEYTLTYNGKSERVTVRMNNIIWNQNES